MHPVLEVIDLKKSFPGVRAVDGISFSIEPGICFGLLGPNGAGKTTTIEIIEGILKEDSGMILYRGEKRGKRFREEVGIQFQSTRLPEYLTVLETLKTFRGLYPGKADMDWIIDVCRLEEILNRDNKKISGGQKQRLLLAMALANNPELIILDEPTTGLDPQARRHLWDIVTGIKNSGRTIILTTHYMEEAEKLCDRIAIMDYGKIIDIDTPDSLLRRHGKGATIYIRTEEPEKFMKALPGRAYIVENGIEVRTDSLNQCIQKISTAGGDLSGMTVRTPNLEDVFLELTGHTLRA
ncbi:MAG TPA: ABC transporter ATP-binding protein [Spirochaetota bacterium]|nr:ABC transporter ATP-binding protein [Spirochaetota bacterium]HPJ34119.1 ABC transporter ATP-binding protein [Spirochaetota bacterium]